MPWSDPDRTKLPKLLKKLNRYQAVIIDDIGYVHQKREEMQVLFTFLAERYERGSDSR